MTAVENIMVALDVDDLESARKIAVQLRGSNVIIKIGNQLATAIGWEAAIALAREYGLRIFCDSKYKDIPETVKLSARAMTRLQPDFFNIMADTDEAVLRAAVQGVESAVQEYGVKRPVLLGVTILTSFSDEGARSVYGASSQEKVLQFAKAAANAGLDGVVCSAKEAKMLRADPLTRGFTLVTPGIRPAWAARGDQSRVMTPANAVAAGADYLVVGRPITQPPAEIGGPREALQKIQAELAPN